jgi:hypothetical protein
MTRKLYVQAGARAGEAVGRGGPRAEAGPAVAIVRYESALGGACRRTTVMAQSPSSTSAR